MTVIVARAGRLTASVVIALLGLLAGSGYGLAQDVAPPIDGASPVAHPAFVYQGTCTDPEADRRFSLSDVVHVGQPGESAAKPAPAAADRLDVRLAELLREPHAVVVRERTEDPETTIACGEIAGTAVGGILSVGLEERNESGYAGIARLLRNGDATVVTTFLTAGLFGTASGPAEAPAAIPECGCGLSEPPDAAVTAVTIIDFLFLPSAIEVKPGATVTWVNDGPGIHTVTVFRVGKLVADSADLPAGRSFLHRFSTPGVYEVLSTSNPSMRARIVVAP